MEDHQLDRRDTNRTIRLVKNRLTFTNFSDLSLLVAQRLKAANFDDCSVDLQVVDCDQYVRKGFLRKVYGILSIQLLATVGVCALSMLLTSDKAIGNYKVLSLGSFIVSSTAFYWTTFILTFVILIALMCYKNVYPINYTLLGVWTIVMSFTVATACVITLCDPMVQSGSSILPFSLAKGPVHLYSGGLFCAVGTPQYTLGANTVLLALAITAAVFVSLTAITLQSKWDFSFMGAGLGVSLLLLMIWGLCMQLFGFGAQMQYLYRSVCARLRACMRAWVCALA